MYNFYSDIGGINMIKKEMAAKLDEKLKKFYEAAKAVYSNDMEQVINNTKKRKEQKKKIYFAQKQVIKEVESGTKFPEHKKKVTFNSHVDETKGVFKFEKIKLNDLNKELIEDNYKVIETEFYVETFVQRFPAVS